jgi:hypothetical protein
MVCGIDEAGFRPDCQGDMVGEVLRHAKALNTIGYDVFVVCSFSEEPLIRRDTLS